MIRQDVGGAEKSLEGVSYVEVLSSSSGFYAVIRSADGAYAETPARPTFDAAQAEAVWRVKAWHDKPEFLGQGMEREHDVVSRDEPAESSWLKRGGPSCPGRSVELVPQSA